jgi:hypothetical protein
MSLIYHLEVEARFCNVLGLVNQFPIYKLDGEKPVVFSRPVNSTLIGKGNVMDFIIRPTHLQDPERKNYSIAGSVKKYQKDDFTGPDQGEVVINFRFENQPAARVTFDNEKFDYKKLLVEGRPIKDKEEVKRYAMKLIGLLSAKNLKPILAEFKPKLDDYAVAYDIDAGEMYDQFSFYLKDKYYRNNPRLDVPDAELTMRSWCEDRIWEVGVGPEMEELLLAGPTERGTEYATTIYVGQVNNELKVVR